MSELLVIFAKTPRPGRVKTRLVPPLTPDQAAEVHAASLRDVVALAASATGDPRIFHDDAPGAREYFETAFPHLPLSVQSAGDLGERMEDAFDRIFASGVERVAIIGADSPTLPPSRLPDAFAAAREHDVVLGPATDGGYYLVAIGRPAWPRARALFREVPWSTDRVLEITMERAGAAGLRTRLIEPWYDVDRIDDLRLARGHAAEGSELAELLRDAAIAAAAGLTPGPDRRSQY